MTQASLASTFSRWSRVSYSFPADSAKPWQTVRRMELVDQEAPSLTGWEEKRLASKDELIWMRLEKNLDRTRGKH